MSDPKYKWKQPVAPPPPMFFGGKERDLVKQVNDELAERVIGQTIAYYPISIEESNFNETYGEAIDKVSLPPVRVYAFVEVENEQSNEKFGYEYQTKLTVNFHRRRLVEDQNLYVRVGDFVQYGEQFYEIVRTYNDTRFLFGQVQHKFQISAECVRARRGLFRVMPSVDRPTDGEVIPGEGGAAPAPRPAPYPPLDASYIVVSETSKLPNDRVLTAGTNITITDGGPNSSLTIAATSAGNASAQGPVGSLQFQTGSGGLSGSANLTFLSASNRLGIATDTPTHNLTIIGNMSASSDVLIGGDLTVQGVVIGGSPLQVSGTIEIVDSTGTVISVLGSSSLGPDVISSSLGILTDLTASGLVSASYFYGDGSNLSGISSGGGIFSIIDGSNAYVTSSLNIGGNTAPDHQLVVSGTVSSSVNISASAYYGDGSNLSGITTTAAGATTQLQFNTSNAFDASANLTYDGSTLLVKAASHLSGGLVLKRTPVTNDYSIALTDYYVGVDTTSNTVDLTIPQASSATEGQTFVIKDEGGNTTTNVITILRSGSDTIDGATSVEINSPYGSFSLYTDGANWFIY